MYGFREVITPALEYAEVIEEPRLRDSSFKLFDPDNQMLLLRPEMTTPIARLVAQRLGNAPMPHKLSYLLPAYRRTGVGRGQSAELYQAGVEAVGSDRPAEDAEVIALLVDVLQSLGLRSPEGFSVVLGQSAFYEGYLRHVASGAAPEILGSLADKDLARVDALSENLPAGVRRIPRLVGSATDSSVLEEAERYAEGEEAASALENLRSILAHLEAHGCLEAVILDLGLIGRRDYYTGAVFEAYASGIGFTVANGGRYDNLLHRFNEDLPATGFAISLERVLSVLPDRETKPLLLLVGGDVEGVRAARELRDSGVPVLRLDEGLPSGDAEEYAREVEAGWVGYPVPEGVELAPVGGEFRTLPLAKVAGEVLP